jgi:hypothetical protein
VNRPLPALSPESSRAGGPSSVQGGSGMRDGADRTNFTDARKAQTEGPTVDAPSRVRGWLQTPRIDPRIGTSIRSPADADPRSARPEVAVRVSVIDGSDRLVYVDARDRRGWKQTLAAEQVASELRKPRSPTGDVISEPRIVRTLDMAPPHAAVEQGSPRTVLNTPTPYSLGKASVSVATSLTAAHQRVPQRPVGSTSAKQSSALRGR